MAGVFAQSGMTAAEFKQEFEDTVLRRYHGAWTLFAETKRGFIQVGMVFAFYSHTEHAMSPFMIIGDIVWFPWATARNKIEAGVCFFDRIRNEIPMMDYAHGETNKKYFEAMCKHGIMRRIGITYNIVRDEPVHIFETRAD